MSARQSTRRLFFALWPEREAQSALADATRSEVLASGGRPVPYENFHITLAFLGSVPEADVARVETIAAEVARQVPRAPVQITLEAIEYWKKVKVLCLTGRLADAQGPLLADALRARLAADFSPDLKNLPPGGFSRSLDFRPHVTLVRSVRRRPPLTAREPITWSFPDFVLVDSKTGPQGSIYTVLERFSLGQ